MPGRRRRRRGRQAADPTRSRSRGSCSTRRVGRTAGGHRPAGVRPRRRLRRCHGSLRRGDARDGGPTLGSWSPPTGSSRVRLPDGRRLDVWQGGDRARPAGALLPRHSGRPAPGRARRRSGSARSASGSSRSRGPATADRPTRIRRSPRSRADAAASPTSSGSARFGVLGVSGGGPFALATAATRPRPGDAVAGVVAGIGPLLELDPAAARRPRGAGSPRRRRAPRRWPSRTRAHDGARPPDRPSCVRRVGGFVSPEILEPWTASGRPGMPSYRGVSRDALAFTRRLGRRPRGHRAPVHLWYGDRDRVVGLEHGQWLHAHLPTSRLVVREGAGHLATLMAHWTDILTELARTGG